MKKQRFFSVVVFIFVMLIGSCEEPEEIKFCGTPCTTAQPWTLESFNQGQPCFATEDACKQWAKTVGGGKCIMCD